MGLPPVRNLFPSRPYPRPGCCSKLPAESLTAEKGARLMRRTAAKQELNGISPATSQEKIELVKWHINRYDRLRGSTTNRAAVVLSAGAILSAGVAVALSQLLSNSA